MYVVLLIRRVWYYLIDVPRVAYFVKLLRIIGREVGDFVRNFSVCFLRKRKYVPKYKQLDFNLPML